MPLGWYFNDQWTRHLGPNWVQQKCDKWIAQDRLLKNFANELPMVIYQFSKKKKLFYTKVLTFTTIKQ